MSDIEPITREEILLNSIAGDVYRDLFDMKQRELDEFAEVCAKQAEQKNESGQDSK